MHEEPKIPIEDCIKFRNHFRLGEKTEYGFLTDHYERCSSCREYSRKLKEKKNEELNPFDPKFWNSEQSEESEKLDPLNQKLAKEVEDDYKLT